MPSPFPWIWIKAALTAGILVFKPGHIPCLKTGDVLHFLYNGTCPSSYSERLKFYQKLLFLSHLIDFIRVLLLVVDELLAAQYLLYFEMVDEK